MAISITGVGVEGATGEEDSTSSWQVPVSVGFRVVMMIMITRVRLYSRTKFTAVGIRSSDGPDLGIVSRIRHKERAGRQSSTMQASYTER